MALVTPQPPEGEPAHERKSLSGFAQRIGAFEKPAPSGEMAWQRLSVGTERQKNLTVPVRTGKKWQLAA